MDTSTLRSAYDTFNQAVEEGGFRAPADPGEWGAELVLAHVVASNRSFAALGAELLYGVEAAYDGAASSRREYLQAIVAAAGDWEVLVRELRQSQSELVALAERVGEAVAGRTFPSVIRDETSVLTDRPQSLESLVNGHATIHLPVHVAQLNSLRG
jgi:hypothetical protein